MRFEQLECRRMLASFAPLENAASVAAIGRWDSDHFDDLAIVNANSSRLRVYTGSDTGLSANRFRELLIPPPQFGLEGTVTDAWVEASPIQGTVQVSMMVDFDPPSEFSDVVSVFWISDPAPRESELVDALLFFDNQDLDISTLVFNDGSDFNGDGVDDVLSLEDATVDLIIAGDANRDGEVAIDDFLTLSVNFGSTDATWADGDFNYGGSVGFDDFLILAENFGRTS
jgi:hypothetical protein